MSEETPNVGNDDLESGGNVGQTNIVSASPTDTGTSTPNAAAAAAGAGDTVSKPPAQLTRQISMPSTLAADATAPPKPQQITLEALRKGIKLKYRGCVPITVKLGKKRDIGSLKWIIFDCRQWITLVYNLIKVIIMMILVLSTAFGWDWNWFGWNPTNEQNTFGDVIIRLRWLNYYQAYEIIKFVFENHSNIGEWFESQGIENSYYNYGILVCNQFYLFNFLSDVLFLFGQKPNFNYFAWFSVLYSVVTSYFRVGHFSGFKRVVRPAKFFFDKILVKLVDLMTCWIIWIIVLVRAALQLVLLVPLLFCTILLCFGYDKPFERLTQSWIFRFTMGVIMAMTGND